MEEPPPIRDHDPLPAVRPGGGPRGPSPRTPVALLLPKGHLLPPEGSPQLAGRPKEQITARGGGGKGQAEAGIGQRCISSGISSNLFHGST